MIKELRIKDAAQVEKICRLACSAPYEIYLHTDTAMLDARSLLGLYALVGKTVRVVAEDSVDQRHFDSLVAQMAGEAPEQRTLLEIVFPFHLHRLKHS